ncbi:ralBP1-associated Eps domain-containing protein 2 isoform X1 [Pelobates fuscus]|uniref:ralBP1-associated Eps domain-containing protein 2 isoform X1 n=1 Tax=Pelobates fuscus TaxID=191477 RepID=UPI002FE43EB1
MDPGLPALPTAQPAGGLHLPLNDSEQKYYSEVFSLCQVEGSARLAAGSSKVGELFRASQLPPDTLHQIIELCGAKHVGYFGPAQFFIALKLIAAVQAGLPLRLESIKCDLPLPRFFSMKSESEMKYGNSPQNIEAQGSQLTITETVPLKGIDEGDKQSDGKTCVVLPQKSPSASPQNYGHGTGVGSADQPNAAAYETRQPALLQQDGQLALNYGNQPAPLQSSLSRSFSVEREVQDSSSNYSDDPWRITEEQREYYTNQFKTLQSDLKSLISGSVAKNFFTKSKLPISELSHIWDLSDVDCDGALTLSEFCAAFHLIVARKNGYELPDTLPQMLLSEIVPSASLKLTFDGVHEAYRGTTTVFQSRKELETVCEDPANSEPLILFDVETSNTEPKTSTEATPDHNALKSDSKQDDNQVVNVNPIVHTVPVEPKGFQTFKSTVRQDLHTPRTRPRSRSYSSTSAEETMQKVEDPPTPPPRPQKTHSRASSLDLNRILQHSSPAARAGWIQAPPPALPPRPCVSQTERVAELELHPQTNKILPQTEESSPAKKEILLHQPPTKPLRRKFHAESQVLENHELSSASSVTSSSAASLKSHPATQRHPSKQKKAIQTAIRKNKEANAVLARLNSELQQQLKEVHQERIALENQLEQLRPVTVL